jgi:cytidylate kinase
MSIDSLSRECGPEVHSVVVAIDGEAKSGKTTVINSMYEQAVYQANIIPALLRGGLSRVSGNISSMNESLQETLIQLQESLTFNHTRKISAGNAFRAATFYNQRLGDAKTQFDASDTEVLRTLLAQEGMIDTLQSDPRIENQVTEVARMAGVQALCGALFCDEIHAAYNAYGGGNLVIVDARDPIGHMRRNNLLGKNPGQVHPASVMPLYIDTPAEDAARRETDEFAVSLERIMVRRITDRTREELPVIRPNNLVEDRQEWADNLFRGSTTRDEPVSPLRVDNSERVSLGDIQHFSEDFATLAQRLGHHLYLLDELDR